MSSPPPTYQRKHQPPAVSGERLFDPPAVATPANPAFAIDQLVDNNRLLRAAFDTRVGDLKLWELVAATRRELLTVAFEYTDEAATKLEKDRAAAQVRFVFGLDLRSLFPRSFQPEPVVRN